ncbi:MAG: hypothetical protein PHS02_01295 [Candidatus ainarchaeum sp.]|nr:hypothetical protein [Candidatus ainarchaeum sp.]
MFSAKSFYAACTAFMFLLLAGCAGEGGPSYTPSYCNGIADEDIKQNCFTTIADQTGSPACDKMVNGSIATCYTNAAMILNNASVCNKIQDTAAKYSCTVRVEANKAARSISKAIDKMTGYGNSS